MENNGKLSKTQGGFRNRMNIIYQVGRVENQVRLALGQREVCLVVFIDLKAAYNKINHKILLNILKNMGVKGNMLKFCEMYVKNREFKVTYNGEKSASKRVEMEVPQGGAISPLLFNMYMADMPRVEGVMRTEYANDIAFIGRAKQ